MFAYNRPKSNSEKKASKFMRGMRINYGNFWFDIKQTQKGRLQMAIYLNIEIKNKGYFKPLSKSIL